MATLSPDVRDSTLNALKLTCPSAEVVHEPHSDSDTDSPTMESHHFVDEDVEWSDEDALLPTALRHRRKTQYIPPHIKITSTVESSSGESSSPSPQQRNVGGSPMLPPKSPSRLDVRKGSSYNDLVQRFNQVTKERDALKKELQRQSVGSHGIPNRASVVYKSEEKSLIEEVHALRFEIRLWSEEYFSGPISSRSKRPHVHSAKALFGNLTDNYNVYLKHPDDRPLLIQAYIWLRLQQKIFNNWQKNSGYVWAGKLGNRKLRPINDTLRKAVKNEEQAEEYHRWRALTVNLLVPQVDGKWSPTFDAAPVLKRISRICSRLQRKMRPWATQSLRYGKEQLHTIISAAVALDLKMKRQRADYRFVTFTGGKSNQYWGYGYYESEMEDAYEEIGDQEQNRKIELALAPALERCGNANGHVFSRSFILVKADVSCKRLEKQGVQARSYGRARTYKGGKELRNFWNKRA